MAPFCISHLSSGSDEEHYCGLNVSMVKIETKEEIKRIISEQN